MKFHIGYAGVKMGEKREQWLDLIRGIAIICVVFEHAYESVDNYLPWDGVGLDVLSECIKTFQMAIFFAISGYLYNCRERKNIKGKKWSGFKVFIHRKAIDLFLPYTIFGCLIWGGKLVFSQWVKYQVDFTDLVMIYVKPISFAWFLYALFLYEIICALIDYLVKKSIVILISLSSVFVFIASLSVNSEADLDKVLYYGFFYVLGILIAEYSWINDRKKGIITLLLYVLIFVIFYHYQGVVLLFAICGVLAVVTFFMLLGKTQFAENVIIKVLTLLGMKSIYIYIIHPVLQHGIRAIFVTIGYMNDIMWLLILTLTGIILPLLYYFIANKVWLLDFPFKPRYCFKRLKDSWRSNDVR